MEEELKVGDVVEWIQYLEHGWLKGTILSFPDKFLIRVDSEFFDICNVHRHGVRLFKENNPLNLTGNSSQLKT